MRRSVPVIILAATLLSLWRVLGRTLYWDDFLIPAIYGDPEFSSLTALFRPHDGHLMPGAIAVQLLADFLAPLSWWLPAIVIVCGTVASGVLWAANRQIRQRPLVLALLCFSPFLGVALGWWSAALNALGWQIACAVALLVFGRFREDATDTRSRRSFDSRLLLRGSLAALAVLGGLLFTERALSIIPLLTALAVFFPAFLFPEQHSPVSWLKRGWLLLPGWVLTAAWAVFYFFATSGLSGPDPGPEWQPAPVVWGAVPRALAEAVFPGMLGGPWVFERWSPGASFAAPGTVLSTIAVLGVLAALIAWLWLGARRGGLGLRILALGLSAGYLLAIFVALALARSGVGTADIITLSLHYYADWFAATVLLAAAADMQAGRGVLNEEARARKGDPARAVGVQLTLALVFAVSATATTAGYLRSWEGDHTGEWAENVKLSLQASPAPLLPQPVPMTIANRFGPDRVDIGDVARSLPDWPGVSDGTPTPQFLLDDGSLVPGGVVEMAKNEQKDADTAEQLQCGQKIPLNKPTAVTLDKPLPFGEWTWVFNTMASTPVNVRIITPNGLESYEDSLDRARRVSVPAELNQQYVRVSGGGQLIELLATPTGSSSSDDYLCLGVGEIGPLLPADHAELEQ